MPCVCTHDKMDHDTERDQGWHQGACSKCECTSFVAKRTFEKDTKSGDIIYPNSTIKMYEKNYGDTKN